jgi:signal transduction histidine kinase
MISNHLVLPAAEAWGSPPGVRRRLRETRWIAAAAVLGGALAYERLFGAQFTLASIGFVSFAAVLQLAPAVLGGLYWRGASRTGALAGICVGGLVWAYTLVVPILARSGWLPASLLVEGPFGVEPLAPEGLFDVHLDAVSHAVLWTLVLNGGAFVLGSLLFPPLREEEERTAGLVRLLGAAPARERDETPAVADATEKRRLAARLFAAYHGEEAGERLADACLARVGARAPGSLTALQLAQLQAEVETCLAAAIGSGAAHAAVRRHPLVGPEESRAISSAYAEILAELNVSPADIQRRIDFHRERERFLAREAEAQRFLAGVGGLLGSSLDVAGTARTAVRLPVPYLAEAALLVLPRHGRDPPRAFFAHADPGREAEASAAAEAATGALERAPELARALATSLPVVVGARPGEESWPPALAASLPRGRRITVPLLAGEQTLGALTLFAGEGGALRPPDEIGLAQELGRRLAIALENARAFERAEEAVRVRDEFLAVASHELKTPLTPLRLRIQTLERLVDRGELGTLPQEKLAQLFRGAEDAVLRVAKLVDDLLDVTRITAGRLVLRPEPMDLSASVRAAVERHAAQLAEARCALQVSAPASLTGAWDPDRIEQVVGNLLANAAKYAPGGRVEVRVEGNDERARIVVRDDGPGIAPEDQERVFLPFERAPREGREAPGLGLGLFIVRQIVEAHGGTIRLASAPGAGTTFTVELPRGG